MGTRQRTLIGVYPIFSGDDDAIRSAAAVITFDIHRDQRLILCRAREAISVLDVANYLQALVRDPRFDPTYYALIIVNDTGCVPPLSMLKFLEPLIAAWTQQRGNAKWAIVLPDDKTKKLVEEALQRLTLHAVRTRCFTDEHLARAWLGELEEAAGATPDRSDKLV